MWHAEVLVFHFFPVRLFKTKDKISCSPEFSRCHILLHCIFNIFLWEAIATMPLGFLNANLKCYLLIHEIVVLEDSYIIRIRSSMDSQIYCNLKVSTANFIWNNAKREYWNAWIHTPDNFPCWISNNAIFRKVFSSNVGFWGSEIDAKQIRQPNQGSRFDM